jgi:hypothetical protein
VAVGCFASAYNQGGSCNTALGTDALRLNTTGCSNTAIGALLYVKTQPQTTQQLVSVH